MFTQRFIQARIKQNIKAPRYWQFVRGIHRGPVNSPHKWPVTRKLFPFDDVIILEYWKCTRYACHTYTIWHFLLFACCILCICLESRQCHEVFMDYVPSNVTKYICRSDVFVFLSALGHQSTYHSLFIDLYNGCDYLCMLGFKLNRVNKRVPIVPLSNYWSNELYTQS